MKIVFITLVALMLHAHELLHAPVEGAYALRFFYADNTPFAYETVEIYAPGESVAFQTGVTDKLGRFAFVPDRPGNWKIKAFSANGHGATVTIHVTETLQSQTDDFWSHYAKIATGLGIIGTLFGLVALYQSRKRSFHA
ncbi:MAG: hypothetical protein K6347_03560 [Campylobacterales bacterium]